MHGAHGCAGSVPGLLYTAMHTTRWLATICCAISLSASGCGAAEPPEAPAATLTVVQVETVTTVQSSAGSFLSPTPEQVVPTYVERGSAAERAESQERARIEVALLFRGTLAGGLSQQLDFGRRGGALPSRDRGRRYAALRIA